MSCIVCQSKNCLEVIKIKNIPTFCNLLFDSKSAALNIQKADIHLLFCEHCGHFFNSEFDQKKMKYGQLYENSLHYSPLFQQYAIRIAKYLIKKYDLYNKTILDIGCGKGDFLELICQLGNNTGYGFDKSFLPAKSYIEKNQLIKFIPDFYSHKYSYLKADFVLCRHVLEHIQDPIKFLEEIINSNIDRYMGVFFEVPNIDPIIKEHRIWDLLYEHGSYFSTTSLEFLFSKCGFYVGKTVKEFANQYLMIEAKTNMKKNNKKNYEKNFKKIETLKNYALNFEAAFIDKTTFLRREIKKNYEYGKRMVIWGGGSKGVSFLNFLDIKKEIEFVVDINPKKDQKYIAATGQKIIHPTFLCEYKPDIIYIMNDIYRQEIEHHLHTIGIHPGLVTV